MADPKTGARRKRTVSTARDTPCPPEDLRKVVTSMIWPKGQVIHRIHLSLYRGIEFNPGTKGNARFSPIEDSAGASVPTLYGGTTFDCAAMETIFHDVPFVVGLRTYDKQRLAGQVLSRLAPRRDLVLADLSATALRKLGLRRNQLIDTEKDRYPETRPWAEAIHAGCPEAEGLCWVSRQDDRARALMLFGDRVPARHLAQRGNSLYLTSNLDIHLRVLALADRIGVRIVDGWGDPRA